MSHTKERTMHDPSVHYKLEPTVFDHFDEKTPLKEVLQRPYGKYMVLLYREWKETVMYIVPSFDASNPRKGKDAQGTKYLTFKAI